MTPKWLQNGAQSRPKTIQRALRTEKHKLSLIFSIFNRPGAPKWRPKISKKLEKPDSGALFLLHQKTTISKTPLLLFFPCFGSPKTSKSSQNAVLYAKIVGQHFLIEVHTFSKSGSKKNLPMHLKTQKIHKKRLPRPS